MLSIVILSLLINIHAVVGWLVGWLLWSLMFESLTMIFKDFIDDDDDVGGGDDDFGRKYCKK